MLVWRAGGHKGFKVTVERRDDRVGEGRIAPRAGDEPMKLACRLLVLSLRPVIAT
jgi:hypothetical protein